MRRKLVQQGKSTLMVSLPKEWVDLQGLRKGDEVELTPKGNTCLLEVGINENATSVASVDLTDASAPEIRTKVVNAYRSGVDRLEVAFSDEKQYAHLLSILSEKLIGFEVVQREQGACTIQNVTEPSGDHFTVLVTKIFQNIAQLFDATLARAKGEESTPIDDIEERILKYDNFCRRALVRQPLTYRAALHLSFFSLIIHANRELYHMNKDLSPVSQPVQDLLLRIREVFDLLKTAYLKKDISHAAPAHRLERELIFETGYSLLSTVPRTETVIVYHALAAARRFYQATSPLTGILQEE